MFALVISAVVASTTTNLACIAAPLAGRSSAGQRSRWAGRSASAVPGSPEKPVVGWVLGQHRQADPAGAGRTKRVAQVVVHLQRKGEEKDFASCLRDHQLSHRTPWPEAEPRQL